MENTNRKKVCQKCGRTKDQNLGFYTYKNGQKAQLCKQCTLMHVNIWQPNTFVWLLEKYDVPWLPWEWDSLREKSYAKNPNKKNDTTVFGKYLAKMKLRQFKDKSWVDSQELQRQHEALMQFKNKDQQQLQKMYAQQFQRGDINQAQYRTLVKASVQKQTDKKIFQSEQDLVGKDNFFNEKNFIPEDQIPDIAADLTEQDKKYLVLKWGRLYTPQEWVQLQKFYNQMMNSFDIQDADTRSSLILICKNNLKMNQAINQE